MQASKLSKSLNIYHFGPMSTFQNRITESFELENQRRAHSGEKKLTKTDLWKAAKASSGAATHWFDGSNGMDMDTCFAVASLLRVSARWLFDGTGARSPEAKEDKDSTEDRRRLSKVANGIFGQDELMLIEGFRLANSETRELMLIMAERSLTNFNRRSGGNNH